MHFHDLPSLIMPEKRKLFIFLILKPTMLLNPNVPDMMRLFIDKRTVEFHDVGVL